MELSKTDFDKEGTFTNGETKDFTTFVASLQVIF